MSTATLSRPTHASDAPTVAALRMTASAHRVLNEARVARDPLERYAFSHLAALRAAAALLSDRAKPSTGRSRRPTSVWTLLVGVAPELEPWAGYFAAGAGKRAAAEAGLRGAVTTREADDLMRDSEAFLSLIETMLGLLPLAVAAG
jgi:SAV_6107-like HEPN